MFGAFDNKGKNIELGKNSGIFFAIAMCSEMFCFILVFCFPYTVVLTYSFLDHTFKYNEMFSLSYEHELENIAEISDNSEE